MMFSRADIHPDNIFYWGHKTTYCSVDCDPIISFMQSTNFYVCGMKLMFVIAFISVILLIVYLLICQYWEYVDDNDAFNALGYNEDGEFVWSPYCKICQVTLWWPLWWKPFLLAFVWPIAVVMYLILGAARIHRAVRRLQKRVDKIERSR